ncbi:hypothetical protein ACHAW6_003005 [Cyclotella cf. meneghiniana]
MVAKYSSNPRQENGQAHIYIAWCLIQTHDLVFTAMRMQIFLMNEIRNLQSLTPAHLYLGVAGSLCVLISRSFGAPIYTHKWLCLLQRRNILPSHKPYMMSYLL